MVGEYSPFWVLREINEKKGHKHPTMPVSTMVLHEFSYKNEYIPPTISFVIHVNIAYGTEKYLKHGC